MRPCTSIRRRACTPRASRGRGCRSRSRPSCNGRGRDVISSRSGSIPAWRSAVTTFGNSAGSTSQLRVLSRHPALPRDSPTSSSAACRHNGFDVIRQPAAMPGEHPQGHALPADAAASQRLLPVASAPRRDRRARDAAAAWRPTAAAGGSRRRIQAVSPAARRTGHASGLAAAASRAGPPTRAARLGRGGAKVTLPPDASRRRHWRHLHGRRPRRSPDGLITSKAPTTPGDQSARRHGRRSRPRWTAAGAEAAWSGVRPRHDGCHQCVAGGNVARTALFATEGFTDLDALGRQDAPQLYRLCAAAPGAPRPRRAALRRAASARGRTACCRRARRGAAARAHRRAPSRTTRKRSGRGLPSCGRSCTPNTSERQCVTLLLEARPELHVSNVARDGAGSSASTSAPRPPISTPLCRRCSPAICAALARSTSGLPGARVMLSRGGLTGAERGRTTLSWTVLSGPAGGAVGAAWSAQAGAARCLCIDMGGTSSTSAWSTAAPCRSGERESGRPLPLPMIDIHTIGAGGGSSRGSTRGGALRVGPRSAGADPGPACYGRGGTEPTVTDANLVLGALPAPPLARRSELDLAAAERRCRRVAARARPRQEEPARAFSASPTPR